MVVKVDDVGAEMEHSDKFGDGIEGQVSGKLGVLDHDHKAPPPCY